MKPTQVILSLPDPWVVLFLFPHRAISQFCDSVGCEHRETLVAVSLFFLPDKSNAAVGLTSAIGATLTHRSYVCVVKDSMRMKATDFVHLIVLCKTNTGVVIFKSFVF